MDIYAKCRGLYLALCTDPEGIVVYVCTKYVGKKYYTFGKNVLIVLILLV